ncbi:unnamed protein product [Ilex paraguariensis]|uniref:non-specific serine/threonine protein kinase n=1 Tax=Ilex paraguariensis TaxID=185542 RepID=A0ABC8TWN5_9AQUA
MLESGRSFIRSGSLLGGFPFELSVVLMLVCEKNKGIVMGKKMVVGRGGCAVSRLCRVARVAENNGDNGSWGSSTGRGKRRALSTESKSSDPNIPICSQTYNHKKKNYIWVIGILLAIVIVGVILFLNRRFSKEKASFFPYDVKIYHRLSFDQHEIIEAMVDKNTVGYGGSGTLYKIKLRNREVVAVKKLRSGKAKDSVSDDELFLDKGLKTEVETLGSIRHKNIVKLYCYFSSLDCSLLYEYMPNGNLWDALHRRKILLDWPTRHQIALGIAQGLAYLHHDLLPPIIHTDIKSTNILLDVEYQPKVADFGIAKVFTSKKYAYSSKATTKCDVYNFGVILMELITGKKPVEAEFGENKNIIYGVSTKVKTKEGAKEALDKQASRLFKDEMIKVLRIAIHCTCGTTALRPTMSEVVQLLIEADPCKFDL